MTRICTFFSVLLFALSLSGCGGGSGSSLSIASFGSNVGSGCSTSDSNQSCTPPGGSDTSAASAVITDTNFQQIANRVAYDLDSLLRQRTGLPPTLVDTIASLMQRIAQPSSTVCTNDAFNPVTITSTGTAGSYSVIINDCQMLSDQNYSLTGSFDVSNYTSTGSSPWVGSANLATIDLTYTLSVDQNLKFDGGMGFATQYDGTTLTSTITPANLRVIKETSNGTGGTDTSYNTFTTGGTLGNATNTGTQQQTLSVSSGYFNASTTGEQLDIPASFLSWMDGFDNPDAGASGTLQITDSTGGSTLVMAPVDETRMNLTLNGSTIVCIGWTELTPAGCSSP